MAADRKGTRRDARAALIGATKTAIGEEKMTSLNRVRSRPKDPGRLGRPAVSRLSRANGPGKNVRSSLPSVLEERRSFFPEPKAFGSADGWPAGGRPAGGGAREGIGGWRDGGKSAVSAIRRRRTLLRKNVGNLSHRTRAGSALADER